MKHAYTNADSDPDKLVKWTYNIADAMLKAREEDAQ